MSAQKLKIHLKIWRQESAETPGKMQDYTLEGVSPDMSFLEMLDMLNDQLIKEGGDPVEFDHDCREGICGMCSLMINGEAHGPHERTTTCQLHMRSFKNEDTIIIEPFRAQAFPVIKDLMVDRSSFDHIIAAGGYTNINAGNAPDANAIPISKVNADFAMDAAACIGCGACVASCKNASAMLFVGAKVSQFAFLPQGDVEAQQRALDMVNAMDQQGFGNCTNERECEAQCPKAISFDNIARMNRAFVKSSLF